MNQLRGEHRGAGVTGKPRGGPRTFAISRLAAHSWHFWDPQEFASVWSRGKGRVPAGGGRCPEDIRPPDLAAGRGPVRKEVGEAWEGKVETENLADPRVQLLLESARPTADAEE